MEYVQTAYEPEIALLILDSDIDGKIERFCTSLRKDINYVEYWDVKDKEFLESNLKLYITSFPEVRVLSLEEELRLGKEKQFSKEAEEDLVANNLPLVVKIAKEYDTRKLDFLDLIQEGNIALLRCARKYKIEFNKKLSHLAGKSIRNAIVNEIIYSDRTIRIPTWIYELIGKLIRTENKFIRKHFRKPNYHELAHEINISKERFNELIRYDKTCDSLDKKVKDGKGVVSKYYFVKDNRLGTEDAAIKLALKSEVEGFLSKYLSERDAEIMRLRFGLRDGIQRTLKEIKANYDLTREGIRLVISRSLKKLRNSPYVDSFRVYLHN